MSEERVIVDNRTPDQKAISRGWWKWIESKKQEDVNLGDAYIAGFNDALDYERSKKQGEGE